VSITAAEFDALLGLGLTPELVAAVRQHNPVGLTDQMNAAVRESMRLMEKANGGTKRVAPAEYGTVDEWVRLGVIDTLLRWSEGRADTCMHDPHLRRPQPVWSAAWKPGLVVCTYCMHLLKAIGDADMTCDCCGHLCAGADSGDAVWTTTVWLGALAYSVGTCRGCRPRCTEPDDDDQDEGDELKMNGERSV
jgi:hypothetical protein